MIYGDIYPWKILTAIFLMRYRTSIMTLTVHRIPAQMPICCLKGLTMNRGRQ